MALQSALADVEALRNALGTIQSLYNFIEGSTKRHALLKNIQMEDDGHTISLTLKALSATRWSCRWMAVKAIYEQIYNVFKALLVLTKDKDPNTYRDSKASLNAICDFNFVLGLLALKIILSNTDALSKYLQGKDVDVVTAKKTADAVVKTLNGCRNEESFELVWDSAEAMGREIKQVIKDTALDFKEATLLRNRQPSKRVQALMGATPGESVECPTTTANYRVNTYYASLDKAILEISARFEKNDQAVVCALADVVFSRLP